MKQSVFSSDKGIGARLIKLNGIQRLRRDLNLHRWFRLEGRFFCWRISAIAFIWKYPYGNLTQTGTPQKNTMIGAICQVVDFDMGWKRFLALFPFELVRRIQSFVRMRWWKKAWFLLCLIVEDYRCCCCWHGDETKKTSKDNSFDSALIVVLVLGIFYPWLRESRRASHYFFFWLFPRHSVNRLSARIYSRQTLILLKCFWTSENRWYYTRTAPKAFLMEQEPWKQKGLRDRIFFNTNDFKQYNSWSFKSCC